jgi:hypothetical protein
MKATMKVKQVPLALFTEEARFMLTNTTINDGKMRAWCEQNQNMILSRTD